MSTQKLKLAALAALGGLCLFQPKTARSEPIADANATILGPNVYVFNTNMANSDIQNVLNSVNSQMQTAQFAAQGYALLFKPGTYYVDCNVGFYTHVAGLGRNPDDVLINGGVNVNAQWNNGEALDNFWRTEENFAVLPTATDTNTDTTPGVTRIAVSQAAPMRRLHVEGELALFDLWPSCHCGDGYASGGFLGDSKVDGLVDSGSQQQWLSRNSTWANWGGGAWNMVFVGCQNAPASTFPNSPNTTVAATPVIREKPYLYVDGNGNFAVFVPSLQTFTIGTTWANGSTPGTSIPISQFYIAQPATDTAATLNTALAAGKNIIFTPGTYSLNGTLMVNNPNAILMGLGVPSLKAANGQPVIAVADVDGVTIASLIIDAGPANSPVLLQVGPTGSSADHSANPTVLYDLTVRTGGPAAAQDTVGVVINSANVVTDNIWIWRADHGNSGAVGWTTNPSQNGLIVNGNHVTCYGLFNEHHEQYQTLWNGNAGQVYMYQSEIPYDVPSQASWMDGSVDGYASYKVADNVTSHNAWGVGIYCYFTDANVILNSAIEAPNNTGVNFYDMTTFWIPYEMPNTQITHIINNTGGTANSSQNLQTLTAFIGSGSVSNQLASPTILAVTTNYGQVILTWSAVSNATSYNIKRSTASYAESTIANTASTSYADTNVATGAKYYYVVSAANSNGESANSAEVTATVPVPPMPAPPVGTVLVDFDGQSDSMPSPDSSGFYWNNISTVANTVGGSVLPLNGSYSPIPLINATNGNSGWTLAINQLGPYGFDANAAPEGDDWLGPYPAAVASFPQTALAHGFTLGGPISVTLAGLNSGLTYNLLVYGTYAGPGQTIQTNTLTVGTSPSPAINTNNASGNSTMAVGWTNVTPVSGQIVFTITSAGVGALNFMEVSPVSSNTTSNTNPPAAPAVLNVTTNYGQVSLTWSWVATATSYNVKRATTSGAETNLVSTAFTSYTDVSVANGTTYYYVVSAVNNIGESTNSAEVHATPPLPPPPPSSGPTVLTVTTNTPGQVGLTWSAVGNATSYNVKRATASGAETTIATTASTSYTDTSVVGGITYYYKVSGTNYSGEGPLSAEVTATPLSPAVLYQEDWGTTNGGASVTVPANVGWNQVLATDFYSGFFQASGAVNDTTGAALPTNSMWFGDNDAGPNLALFYTTNGAGRGTYGDSAFAGIDPTLFTNLEFSVYAQWGWNGGALQSWFAVQVGGAWYVSTNHPIIPSQTGGTNYHRTDMIYSPAATNWNKLTVNASVSIGGPATTALSGPITGIGLVAQSTGGWWNINVLQVTSASTASTMLGRIVAGAVNVRGNSLTLNWAASANIHLQSATNLIPPVVWTDVPDTAGQGSATITTTNVQMFFRLSQ